MSSILIISLIVQLLFYAAVIGLGVFVQVKLSRSHNKYLGLILPVITFLIAGLITLGLAAFTVGTVTTTNVVIESEIDEQSGEVIENTDDRVEEIVEVREVDLDISSFLRLSFTFLVSNIPTVVLSGIYISERNNIKMRKEIEKMKISDL